MNLPLLTALFYGNCNSDLLMLLGRIMLIFLDSFTDCLLFYKFLVFGLGPVPLSTQEHTFYSFGFAIDQGRA